MTELNIDSFNLAAIDVGSNAARLLIKHVDIDVDGNRSLNKLLFLRIPLRLGMDVFGDGRISKERSMEFLSDESLQAVDEGLSCTEIPCMCYLCYA